MVALTLDHSTVTTIGSSAGHAAWRPQRGGVALLVCTLLLGASLLLAITLHRLTVQRELAWSLQLRRLQVQALGHGGLMWVMARLEDSRPIDERCRALPVMSAGGSTGSSFAQRWAQPGMRLRCQVMLDMNTMDEGAWQCDCSSGEGGTPPKAPSNAGILDITFDPVDDGLLLAIHARGPGTAPSEVSRWSESVRLRRDTSDQWRAVVGTWMDSR